MTRVDLAEAKAHLSQLVEKAAAGETIQIVQQGQAVAQITKVDRPRRKVDVVLMQSVTARMTASPHTAGEFLREMRESSRY